MNLTGINQITLRVNDVRLVEEFYSGILGFRVDHRAGANISYLRLNSDMLVLVKAETPGTADARDIRVDHFGFRLASDDEVDEAAVYLDDRGVHLVTRPAHRREGRAFFVMDPDGNLIEFYSMKATGLESPVENIDTRTANEIATDSRREMAAGNDIKKTRRSRK
ncbi:glyoxalase [Chlorobaculum limnaeum]|uniref:Glyoxalase n=1 Tax=Chlorobaculum limnaeum TaxID=274537 RepID=A0A1D8D983_CHLLM|nr:VOC family protein [Chlorobaculum limnaeum]AOS84948.1 glyoxalase [Chlorobaculum limnaeum]